MKNHIFMKIFTYENLLYKQIIFCWNKIPLHFIQKTIIQSSISLFCKDRNLKFKSNSKSIIREK